MATGTIGGDGKIELSSGQSAMAVVVVDTSGASASPSSPAYASAGVPAGSPLGPLFLRSDGARTGSLPGVPTASRNLAAVNVGGGAGVFTDVARGALFITAGASETLVITSLSLIFNTSSGTMSWADSGYGNATTALTNGLCLEIASGSVGAAGVNGTVVWRAGTGLTTYGAGTGFTINRDFREFAGIENDALVIVANTRIRFPFAGIKLRPGGLVVPPGQTLRLVGQDTVTIGSMARIELQISGVSITA